MCEALTNIVQNLIGCSVMYLLKQRNFIPKKSLSPQFMNLISEAVAKSVNSNYLLTSERDARTTKLMGQNTSTSFH